MTDPTPPAPGRPAPDPRRIRLGADHAGERLDLYLTAELSLSRGQVRRLLAAGAVRLDGRRLDLGDKGLALPATGEIAVDPWRAPADQRIPAAPAPGLPVLASGPGWLAVDKPAGLPVHPLREDETETVLGHVAARWPEVQGVGEGGLRSGVVHRLDVETSGVLLVATGAEAWSRLRRAFAEHRVEKTYRAIVRGRLEAPAAIGGDGGGFEMSRPLVVARHRPAFVRVARADEVSRGRARTVHQRVRVLERFDDATLVAVHPTTGFLHQIRATLADLGHPLLGDRRYADGATAARAPRHMLHAAHARLDEIEASAPDAADFAACLGALRERAAGG